MIGQVHDNYTSNDEEYYGAEFYQEEDHGTAHVSVLAPNGYEYFPAKLGFKYFHQVTLLPSHQLSTLILELRSCQEAQVNYLCAVEMPNAI